MRRLGTIPAGSALTLMAGAAGAPLPPLGRAPPGPLAPGGPRGTGGPRPPGAAGAPRAGGAGGPPLPDGGAGGPPRPIGGAGGPPLPGGGGGPLPGGAGGAPRPGAGGTPEAGGDEIDPSPPGICSSSSIFLSLWLSFACKSEIFLSSSWIFSLVAPSKAAMLAPAIAAPTGLF